MLAEEPGLDWLVVLGLDELKSIEQDLLLHGDDYKQLPNVREILAAYRTRSLLRNFYLILVFKENLLWFETKSSLYHIKLTMIIP